MADIKIHTSVYTAEDGNILRLTVRGCEVLAIFAAQGNPEVYQHIRHVLLESCMASLMTGN